MKIISFVSAKGGTGRTTLAANTAYMLAHCGFRCAALDLDPQNALGTHFGMNPGERIGIAPGAAPSGELAAYLAARSRLPHIPFGWCSPERLRLAEAAVAKEPEYVHRRVAELVAPETQFLIVDTPAGDDPWLHRALAVSDAVVVVHLPDAASFATLPLLQNLLRLRQEPPAGGIETWHVVNQMDSRSALARDALGALGHAVGDGLLPFTVPRDAAVPEALAMQLPLVQYRPDCAALLSFGRLAELLSSGKTAHAQRQTEPLQLAR